MTVWYKGISNSIFQCVLAVVTVAVLTMTAMVNIDPLFPPCDDVTIDHPHQMPRGEINSGSIKYWEFGSKSGAINSGAIKYGEFGSKSGAMNSGAGKYGEFGSKREERYFQLGQKRRQPHALPVMEGHDLGVEKVALFEPLEDCNRLCSLGTISTRFTLCLLPADFRGAFSLLPSK